MAIMANAMTTDLPTPPARGTHTGNCQSGKTHERGDHPGGRHSGGTPTYDALAALETAVQRARSGQAPWQLFDRRINSHHQAMSGFPSERLDPSCAPEHFHSALSTPVKGRRRAIYVHVPFCRRLCSFCAFFRQPTKDDALVYRYGTALLMTTAMVSGTAWATSDPIEAVYFGGGTPTTLLAEDLIAVVRMLRKRFMMSPECEITVETRCSDVDDAYLSQLREAGVNRLSFGVQSFDTTVRQDVGRVASDAEVLTALEQAQRIGFERISIDLIYNLPRETEATWQRDLDLLEQSPASAASVYDLIPVERSPLQRRISRGDHPPLGNLASQYARCEYAANRLLARQQWQRYSAVHFGNQQTEQSVYNSLRGQVADVLAIGAGGGGKIGAISYMNVFDVDAFVASEGTLDTTQMMVSRSPAKLDELKAVLALSAVGQMEDARLRELLPDCGPVLEQLSDCELIEQHDADWRLTTAGCFWSYNIGAILAELICRELRKG